MDSDQAGRKETEDKPPMELLPWKALWLVAFVFGWAITEKTPPYKPHEWKLVEDAESKYCASALRHISDHLEGNHYDEQSKILSLAHAAAAILIALWHAMRNRSWRQN
jgi:hypothetical protein